MKLTDHMKLQRMLLTQRAMKTRVAMYQHRQTCPDCRAGREHGSNNIFTQILGQVRTETTPDPGTKH